MPMLVEAAAEDDGKATMGREKDSKKVWIDYRANGI